MAVFHYDKNSKHLPDKAIANDLQDVNQNQFQESWVWELLNSEWLYQTRNVFWGRMRHKELWIVKIMLIPVENGLIM